MKVFEINKITTYTNNKQLTLGSLECSHTLNKTSYAESISLVNTAPVTLWSGALSMFAMYSSIASLNFARAKE